MKYVRRENERSNRQKTFIGAALTFDRFALFAYASCLFNFRYVFRCQWNFARRIAHVDGNGANFLRRRLVDTGTNPIDASVGRAGVWRLFGDSPLAGERFLPSHVPSYGRMVRKDA